MQLVSALRNCIQGEAALPECEDCAKLDVIIRIDQDKVFGIQDANDVLACPFKHRNACSKDTT